MIFNGHTEESVNALSEEVFAEILTMYVDGMVGNRAIYDAMSLLTAGVFNYIRQEGSPPYRPDTLFPGINEYLRNPDFEPSKEEQVSNSLMAYMSQAKGFKKERFKK